MMVNVSFRLEVYYILPQMSLYYLVYTYSLEYCHVIA